MAKKDNVWMSPFFFVCCRLQGGCFLFPSVPGIRSSGCRDASPTMPLVVEDREQRISIFSKAAGPEPRWRGKIVHITFLGKPG